MSPRLRRWSWIAGIVLGLALVAALAAPLLVDINRYHDSIEAKAESTLGREVSLGRMSLRLLPRPGVSISPLAIGSDLPSDPPLLKARTFTAHARLLPLLRGRIEVASLAAHQPEVFLRRHPDGRFNLPSVSGAAPSPRPEAAAPGAGGAPFSLSRLRITGARLRFVDEAVMPGRTVTTALKDVEIAIEDFAPGRPFELKLESGLPGKGSFTLTGTLALPPDQPGRSAGATDLALRIRDFRPASFAPYVKSLAGVEPPAGRLSASLELQARLRAGESGAWQAEAGALRGSMELRGVGLHPAPGRPAVAGGDLDLGLDLALDRGGRKVSFRKLEATTGKSRLSATGSLEFGAEGPRINLTVRPSRVMAQDLATIAALLGAKFPAGLSSSSPIGFSGAAAGPLDHPERLRFRGEIALAGVRFAGPPLGRPVEEAGGRLRFENGSLRVDGFSARVGTTQVRGSLAVKDFSSPQLSLNLDSPKADLDDLMGLMAPSTLSGSPAATGSGDDVLGRTRGTGTIRIAEGSLGTFAFSRFDGRLTLQGKVVTFDPVSFQLYGGSYRGALTADLRGTEPRFAYRSSLLGVNAQPFLAANLGIPDLLAGVVSADLELAGKGAEVNTILTSLQGRGTVRVEKGWIGRLNVLEGLSKASKLLGERTLARVSASLARDRTDFTSLTGDIEVAGGRASTRNLSLQSRDLDLAGTGSFAFPESVDLDVKVLFSKELTAAMLQEGSRARYLEREGDRIVLPLTVRGTLAAPSYGVDLSAVTRAAAKSEALKRLAGSDSTLGRLAGGLLGGGAEAPPKEPAPDSAADSPAKPPSGAAAPGTDDGAIRITSRSYGGGLLIPDLTIKGEFSGVGLVGADLRVEGKGGRVVMEKKDAFREIAAYLAAHAATAPARIPFRLKIDGKQLAGSGDLTFRITLRRGDGTASTLAFSEKKPGL